MLFLQCPKTAVLPWITHGVRSALRFLNERRVCPGSSPHCGPLDTDDDNLIANGELLLVWTSGFT